LGQQRRCAYSIAIDSVLNKLRVHRTLILEMAETPFFISEVNCLLGYPSKPTPARGKTVKKLNTHMIYELALAVHPLTELKHQEDMTLGTIVWEMWKASTTLPWHVGKQGIFSPSLKRAAGALMASMHATGLPVGTFPEVFKADTSQKIQPWVLSSLVEAAKEFEIVLGNELPGLATYIVSQKGIYSTDDLISNADQHFAEETLAKIPPNARQDICAGGKCLAFELPTASAFHM
jgi:hypothetical protein